MQDELIETVDKELNELKGNLKKREEKNLKARKRYLELKRQQKELKKRNKLCSRRAIFNTTERERTILNE